MPDRIDSLVRNMSMLQQNFNNFSGDVKNSILKIEAEINDIKKQMGKLTTPIVEIGELEKPEPVLEKQERPKRIIRRKVE